MPHYVRWRTLQKELTKQFGRITDALSVILRKRVLHRLLAWIQPAYYQRADPEFFDLESFLRTLSTDFDPTGKTGIPRFDRQLNLLPLPIPDHRECRHLLNSSNRCQWQAMCDHIENWAGPGSLPAKWHRREGFIRELKGIFDPMEDFMTDYALDFLFEVVKPHTQEPPALPVTSTRGRKGRRSRAKHLLTPHSPGGRAPDFAALEALADLDIGDGGLPSDLDDRFGSTDWRW